MYISTLACQTKGLWKLFQFYDDDDEDFGDIDDDLDGLGDIDDDEPAIAALDIPIPSGIQYQRYETPQERESIEGFNGELIL